MSEFLRVLFKGGFLGCCWVFCMCFWGNGLWNVGNRLYCGWKLSVMKVTSY